MKAENPTRIDRRLHYHIPPLIHQLKVLVTCPACGWQMSTTQVVAVVPRIAVAVIFGEIKMLSTRDVEKGSLLLTLATAYPPC